MAKRSPQDGNEAGLADAHGFVLKADCWAQQTRCFGIFAASWWVKWALGGMFTLSSVTLGLWWFGYRSNRADFQDADRQFATLAAGIQQETKIEIARREMLDASVAEIKSILKEQSKAFHEMALEIRSTRTKPPSP